MKNKTIAFFLLIQCNLIAQINRIENSIYPSSSIPDTLYVIQDLNHTEQELFLVQSLQGILAKSKPKIFRERGSGSSIWINDLVQNYNVTRIDSFDNNLTELIEMFTEELNGYILCNAFDESSNIAISLSGLTRSLAVPVELEQVALDAGLSLHLDVRDKEYEWVLKNYGEELSKNCISYQKEEKGNFLGDYSIFTNSFHFYSDIHDSLTEEAFKRMNPNSVLFGWGDDEYQTIRKSSEYGIGVHPADWAFNLSTLTNFNAETTQKTPLYLDTVTQENTHTVCFLMSDGDNIQWMLNLFADDSRWFGSENRGQMPIGWTIPPAMSELAPTVMHKLYEMSENTTSGRDYFVAGPSGNTYNFPDFFTDLEGQCSTMDTYLERSDLSIVNILGNSDNPRILSHFTEMEHVDGVFYYDYGNYSKGEGKIYCDSWKPIVQSRFNLWGGFETCESMAEKLNSLPKTPENEDGYSLIAVHAWSNSVDSLLYVKSLLENNVRVVSPDEFVYLISRNICNKSLSMLCYPNPTAGELKIQFEKPFDFVDLQITDFLGRQINFDYVYNASVNGFYFDVHIKEDVRGLLNVHVLGENNTIYRKIFKY